MSIYYSLQKAFAKLFTPSLFLKIIFPIVLITFAWLGLILYFGPDWSNQMAAWGAETILITYLTKFLSFFSDVEAITLSTLFSNMVLILLSLISLYLIILIFTSVALAPLLIKFIGNSDFTDLDKKYGGNFFGSLFNTLIAAFVYLLLLILSLPLWLVPGMQFIIPFVLNAYLTKKVFCYDVLQDYASSEERKTLLKNNRSHLIILSLIQSLFFYIPILNFMTPALSVMSYIYYLLSQLKKLRSTTAIQSAK